MIEKLKNDLTKFYEYYHGINVKKNEEESKIYLNSLQEHSLIASPIKDYLEFLGNGEKNESIKISIQKPTIKQRAVVAIQWLF